MKIFAPILLLFLILIGNACSKERDYSHRSSYFKNSSTSYTADSVISCVTFNIHQGFKGYKDPWDKNETGADYTQVKNIANVIRNLSPFPQVIALQEVPRNRFNAVVKDFIEALAAELNLNYAYGAHGYNDPYGIYPVEGEWGNAILTKFEIISINNHEIEYQNQWKRRSLLDATLKINASLNMNAISLHYLPSPEAVPATKTHLLSLNNPVIMMGDYNTVGAIETFDSLGLMDVDSTYTQHRIDRFFVSKNFFHVHELGTLPDSNSTSDHPANYTILKF